MLTIFCGNFLHDLDLEIALDDQLLQPRILGLTRTSKSHAKTMKWRKSL
jgi:hypothetical protein